MIMTTNSEVFRSSGGLEGCTERSGAHGPDVAGRAVSETPIHFREMDRWPHPLVGEPEDEPKAD